uniref:Uncharacterized protein n=1 Tax=Yoonia rhodophyticola TaxID=3137370 RepID=A0AAN0MAL7_9RHOB
MTEVAHLIPAMHGAINFPFMDPGTVSDSFGADPFSDAYIEQHAVFTAKLLRFSLQNL